MEIGIKKLKLDVQGMSCANCAAGIKKHLENKGLEDVNVNFSTGEASWENSNKLDKEKVQNIITELGYTIKKRTKDEERGLSFVEKYFYFTLIFTLPLFSHMFFNEDSFIQNPVLQFFLCLPVYIVGIKYFGKSRTFFDRI